MFSTIFNYPGIKAIDRTPSAQATGHGAYSRVRNLGLFCLALGLSTPGLFAQPAVTKQVQAAAGASKSTLTAILTQKKVVTSASGSEVLEDASTVKPGDVIEYRVTYTNHGQRPVAQLKAQLPIPEGLEYLPLSAKPGADLVKAATKDGVFAPEPLMRRGSEKQVAVPYSEYRHMQWTLGVLPANGVAVVSARARVETVVPVKIPTGKRIP